MSIEKAFTHTQPFINVSREIHAYAYVCVCVQVYTSNWETLCLVFQTMTGSKLCLVKTLNSLSFSFSLSVCTCVFPLCTLYSNLYMPHTQLSLPTVVLPTFTSFTVTPLALSLFTSPVRFGLYHHRTPMCLHISLHNTIPETGGLSFRTIHRERDPVTTF